MRTGWQRHMEATSQGEWGNTQTETEGLIYMDTNEGTLAGSVPDGVYAIQDTCYLIVTLELIDASVCLPGPRILPRSLQCAPHRITKLDMHLELTPTKYPHIPSHVKTASLVQFLNECQIESAIYIYREREREREICYTRRFNI